MQVELTPAEGRAVRYGPEVDYRAPFMKTPSRYLALMTRRKAESAA